MLHRHRIEFVVVACLISAAAIWAQRRYFPLHPIAYQALISKTSPRDYRALDDDAAKSLGADARQAGLQQLYIACVDPACAPLASSIALALEDDFAVGFDAPRGKVPDGITVIGKEKLARDVAAALEKATGEKVAAITAKWQQDGMAVIVFGRLDRRQPSVFSSPQAFLSVFSGRSK